MTTSNYMPNVTAAIAFEDGFSTPDADRTWVDVSDYVELAETIAIGFGRQNEHSIADANTLTLTLDNSDGRFSPENASSPYYPNMKVGRPIRVQVTPVGSVGNFLAANQASFEGLSSVTDWWTVGGTVPPAIARSVVRAEAGSASMLITWGTAGTLPLAQTVVEGLVVGRTYTATAYGYVPTGDPGVALAVAGIGVGTAMTTKDAFTRFSFTFTATATSHLLQVWPNTTPTAGDQAWIDAVQVWEGSSAVTWTGTQASTVISDRFTGYVDEWPIEWNGTDAYAASRVLATSRLARLGLNTRFRSIIEQEILRDAPFAYWPLGEPEAATRGADVSGHGNDPLVRSSSGVTFGTGTGPVTDGLAAPRIIPSSLEASAHLEAGLELTASSVTLEAFFALAAGNSNDGLKLASLFGTDDGSQLGLNVVASTVEAFYRSTAGGVNPLASVGASLIDGAVHHVGVVFTAGATAQVDLYIDGALADSDTELGVALPALREIRVGPLTADTGTTPFTVAHVAIFDNALDPARIAAHAAAGLEGFAGDTAAQRLERYADWSGIPAAEVSASGDTVLDDIATSEQQIVDLMRIVETSEHGVLYDDRDGTLRLDDRAARYLAAVGLSLSMAEQQVEADYTPRLDRSALVNDVTVASLDGSFVARSVDEASVAEHGEFSGSLGTAASDPDEPAMLAGWLTASHSQPETRVPTLSVSLLPTDVDQDALLAAGIGTLVEVTDVPSQVGGGTREYFIEGCTETIGPERYVLTFNVSPAVTEQSVFVLDDPVRGELDATMVLGL